MIFEINWNQHRVLTCFERWIISGISAHVQLKFFLIIAFKFYINIKSKIAYSISWISWQKIVGKKNKKKDGEGYSQWKKKSAARFWGKYSVLIQLNINPMKQSKIDES